MGNPVNATKTSIGDVAELLSDSGSSVHCCGPHDFPDHDLYKLSHTKEFNAANGQPLRCTGYKNVTIEKDGTELILKFLVLDVKRPILSVSQMQENSNGNISTHYEKDNNYIHVRCSSTRLGLVARFGIFLLQATVVASQVAGQSWFGRPLDGTASDVQAKRGYIETPSHRD